MVQPSEVVQPDRHLSKAGAALGLGAGAAAGAAPFLPIFGGLAGAALAGWGISRLGETYQRENVRTLEKLKQSNNNLLSLKTIN